MMQLWLANSWDTVVLGLHTTNQERVWSRLKSLSALDRKPHYWTVGQHRDTEAEHSAAMGEMLLWSARDHHHHCTMVWL